MVDKYPKSICKKLRYLRTDELKAWREYGKMSRFVVTFTKADKKAFGSMSKDEKRHSKNISKMIRKHCKV